MNAAHTLVRLEIKRMENIKRAAMETNNPDSIRAITLPVLDRQIKKHRHILEGRNV